MPISINGTTGISGVDGSAAAPALQGSDTNTGIAFGSDVIIGSTGGTERFRCDSSGRVLVGTSTSRSSFFNDAAPAQFQTEIAAAAGLVNASFVNNGGGAGVIIGRSNGSSVGSNTIVSNGDSVGFIDFQAADGTNFEIAARIEAAIDGTPGNNDMPGRLTFSTTADGGSSPTERLRIANNGQLSAVVPGNSTLYPGFMARAWVSFNGTGTVAIIGSGNVSSITDNGVGIYAVNFTTALPDGNYAVATGFKRIATSSEFVNVGFSNSTTSFSVEFFAGGGTVDTSNMQLVIFR